MYDKDITRYQPYERGKSPAPYVWMVLNEVNTMALVPFDGELYAIYEFSYSNKGKKGWRKVVISGRDLQELETTAAESISSLREALNRGA